MSRFPGVLSHWATLGDWSMTQGVSGEGSEEGVFSPGSCPSLAEGCPLSVNCEPPAVCSRLPEEALGREAGGNTGVYMSGEG